MSNRSAAPFATDIPDGPNAPKEQVGQKKSLGKYAPSLDTAKPWAEGSGSKVSSKGSSAEYGNFDQSQVTRVLAGPKLGDSNGGVPYATAQPGDSKPGSARPVPEGAGVPWATDHN